jgi:flagellar basal-body rod modification protein FlgD
MFQAQTAALVGKTVQVSGSGFNLSSGSAAMGLKLGASANVTLTVKDANGQLVALIPEGQLTAGNHTLTWNGKDANGVTLPDGAYSVGVSATAADGSAATTSTNLLVKVDSVSFQNGAVYLNSGNSSYALTDVTKINA